MTSDFCKKCKAILLDADYHIQDGLITRYRTPGGQTVLEHSTEMRTAFEAIIEYPTMDNLRTPSGLGCSFCSFMLRSFERHRGDNPELWADRLGDAEKFKVTAVYDPSLEFGGTWFRVDTDDQSPAPRSPMLHTLQLWVVAGDELVEYPRSPIILEFPLYANDDCLRVGQFLRIHRRELQSATMSPENIQRMRSWLAVCYEKHANCAAIRQRSSPKGPFPARLVDIGLGSPGESPRVVLTKDLMAPAAATPGPSLKYSALSYCWGPPSSMMMTTTKANIKERLAGLPRDKTPKTFRDAFEVNRQLGLRYIWIDALCIVQDDDADWRTEAAKMGSVYRNAHVTLAAVASASTNDGFIHPRKPAQTAGVKIPFKFNDVDGHFWAGYGYSAEAGGFWERRFNEDVDETKWNERGWTFQERFLSRRTLYFGQDMIHFECLTSRKSENMAGEYGPSSDSWVQLLRGSSNSSMSGTSQATLRKQIIYRFCLRSFTYEKDRLPAFEGIAQELNMALAVVPTGAQDAVDYACGMWSDGLFEDLLWSRGYTSERRNASSGIPSWSWAHSSGGVSWPRRHNGDYFCDVMPMCNIRLRGPPVNNKGLVNTPGDTFIEVEGYLACLTLDKSQKKAALREKGAEHDEYLEADGVEGEVRVCFDVDASLDDLDKVNKGGVVYLAPTCARLHTSEDCAFGLVLIQDNKTRSGSPGRQSFSRVGTFNMVQEFEWAWKLGDEVAFFQKAAFQVL